MSPVHTEPVPPYPNQLEPGRRGAPALPGISNQNAKLRTRTKQHLAVRPVPARRSLGEGWASWRLCVPKSLFRAEGTTHIRHIPGVALIGLGERHLTIKAQHCLGL